MRIYYTKVPIAVNYYFLPLQRYWIHSRRYMERCFKELKISRARFILNSHCS